jgi:hypothetical protein
MKNAVGDKECAAVVAVSEMLTRLISMAFSLAFYTIFSHPDPPLKPCGYFTCLNDVTRVVLTQPLRRRMARFT